MNIPYNEEEYTQWLLSGYTLGDLISEISTGWVLDNFEWLDRVGLISNVIFDQDERVGHFIRIYIDNGYADYSMFSGTDFSRAYDCYQQYQNK